MVCVCRPVQVPSVSHVHTAAAMFISRHDMRLVYTCVDPSVLFLIGYDPKDLIGRSAYQFHNPADAQRCSECHTRLIKNGTGVSVYYRFLGRTGVWVWLQTNATIVSNTRGQPQYIVCSNYIISQKEAQRSMQMELELEAKGQGQGHGPGHDLHALLTGSDVTVRGALDLQSLSQVTSPESSVADSEHDDTGYSSNVSSLGSASASPSPLGAVTGGGGLEGDLLHPSPHHLPHHPHHPPASSSSSSSSSLSLHVTVGSLRETVEQRGVVVESDSVQMGGLQELNNVLVDSSGATKLTPCLQHLQQKQQQQQHRQQLVVRTRRGLNAPVTVTDSPPSAVTHHQQQMPQHQQVLVGLGGHKGLEGFSAQDLAFTGGLSTAIYGEEFGAAPPHHVSVIPSSSSSSSLPVVAPPSHQLSYEQHDLASLTFSSGGLAGVNGVADCDPNPTNLSHPYQSDPFLSSGVGVLRGGGEGSVSKGMEDMDLLEDLLERFADCDNSRDSVFLSPPSPQSASSALEASSASSTLPPSSQTFVDAVFGSSSPSSSLSNSISPGGHHASRGGKSVLSLCAGFSGTSSSTEEALSNPSYFLVSPQSSSSSSSLSSSDSRGASLFAGVSSAQSLLRTLLDKEGKAIQGDGVLCPLKQSSEDLLGGDLTTTACTLSPSSVRKAGRNPADSSRSKVRQQKQQHQQQHQLPYSPRSGPQCRPDQQLVMYGGKKAMVPRRVDLTRDDSGEGSEVDGAMFEGRREEMEEETRGGEEGDEGSAEGEEDDEEVEMVEGGGGEVGGEGDDSSLPPALPDDLLDFAMQYCEALGDMDAGVLPEDMSVCLEEPAAWTSSVDDLIASDILSSPASSSSTTLGVKQEYPGCSAGKQGCSGKILENVVRRASGTAGKHGQGVGSKLQNVATARRALSLTAADKSSRVGQLGGRRLEQGKVAAIVSTAAHKGSCLNNPGKRQGTSGGKLQDTIATTAAHQGLILAAEKQSLAGQGVVGKKMDQGESKLKALILASGGRQDHHHPVVSSSPVLRSAMVASTLRDVLAGTDGRTKPASVSAGGGKGKGLVIEPVTKGGRTAAMLKSIAPPGGGGGGGGVRCVAPTSGGSGSAVRCAAPARTGGGGGGGAVKTMRMVSPALSDHHYSSPHAKPTVVYLPRPQQQSLSSPGGGGGGSKPLYGKRMRTGSESATTTTAAAGGGGEKAQTLLHRAFESFPTPRPPPPSSQQAHRQFSGPGQSSHASPPAGASSSSPRRGGRFASGGLASGSSSHTPSTSTSPLPAPVPANGGGKPLNAMTELEKHLRGLVAPPDERGNDCESSLTPVEECRPFLERLLTGEMSHERYRQIDYHLLYQERERRLSENGHCS